jgi:Tfp pilus assembly protein PilV
MMGIAFMGIVLLGLAQLFCLSVMNNQRSGNVTSASFLAQQEIDLMRNCTADELRAAASNPIDDQVDVNSDGTIDFRRITQVKSKGFNWSVEILVFSPAQLSADVNELIANPGPNKVRSQIATIISR